jgi:hypothetical protein
MACFILLIASPEYIWECTYAAGCCDFSDCAGFILLFFNQWIFKRIEKNPEKDRLYLGLIFGIGSSTLRSFTYSETLPTDGTHDALKADGMKTLGAMVGTVCGVYWDFRKIRFSKSEKPWINWFRFFIGLAVLLS